VNDPLLRAANRRPETWPDPQRFDPDRHFDPDQSSRTLLPFELGPRGCIGQHLAMAEMIMVLPLLAHHGDIRIDDAITEDASFALRVPGDLDGRFVPPVGRASISPRPAEPEG
jgi:cytochrome P450